jgi:hypothetical protein
MTTPRNSPFYDDYEPRSPSDEWIEAWVEGAKDVWAQVVDKI